MPDSGATGGHPARDSSPECEISVTFHFPLANAHRRPANSYIVGAGSFNRKVNRYSLLLLVLCSVAGCFVITYTLVLQEKASPILVSVTIFCYIVAVLSSLILASKWKSYFRGRKKRRSYSRSDRLQVKPVPPLQRSKPR